MGRGGGGQLDVGNWNLLAFTVKGIDSLLGSLRALFEGRIVKCHILLLENGSVSW